MKITLYVGLNDKDTKKQEIATEQAEQLIYEKIYKFTAGASIQKITGLYKHEDGQTVIENSYKIEIFNGYQESDKQLKNNVSRLVKSLRYALNQETIGKTIEQEKIMEYVKG